MPSTDIQQAKADMFSEGVYDLENKFIRAVITTDPERKVNDCLTRERPKSVYSRHRFLAKILELSPSPIGCSQHMIHLFGYREACSTRIRHCEINISEEEMSKLKPFLWWSFSKNASRLFIYFCLYFILFFIIIDILCICAFASYCLAVFFSFWFL